MSNPSRRLRRYRPADLVDLTRVPELPTDPETVVAALSPLLTEERVTRIDEVIAARTRSVTPVLDGLIDPRNISAVLRSADAFGAQNVHIIDRNPELFRAASTITKGAERWLDIKRHETPKECVEHLHQEGYRVLVASMDGDVTPPDLQTMERVAIVFGNERDGVSEEMRAMADATYSIPMVGFVESLNVSVANAITLRDATQGRHGDLSSEEQLELRARFMMLSVTNPAEVVAEYERRNP